MLGDTDNAIDRQNVSVLARGGAAGLLGNFLGVALALVWQFSLARILGSAGLGDISLAFSVVTILSLLVPLGLDSGALRFVSFHHGRGDRTRTAGVILYAVGLSSIICWVVTPVLVWQAKWIAINIFGKPGLAGILRILMLGIPLFTALQVLAAVIQGFKKIGTQQLVQQILVPLFRLLGLLAVVFVSRSVSTDDVSVLIVAASGLGGILLAVAVYRQHPFQGIAKASLAVPIAGLFGYSLQALLMSAVSEIGNGSQTLFLGVFASSSEIGIYAVALKAAMVLGLFLASLNLIAAPAISGLYARDDRQGIRSLYQVITRWALILTMPFFVIMVIFASQIMAIFGPEFRAGAPVLQLIAVGQIINAATGPCGWILNMTNHQRLNLLNNAAALVVAGTLSWILIPTYGAIGAAAAMGCSIALINLMRLLEVYQVLNVHPYSFSFLKPIGAGLAAGVVAFGIDRSIVGTAESLRLVAGITIVGGLYGLLTLALKLEPVDRVALQDIRGKGR